MSWRLVAIAVAIVVAVAALALSGHDEERDLKQELAEASRDFRGKVPPLPHVKPAVRVSYGAGALPDPFYPDSR